MIAFVKRNFWYSKLAQKKTNVEKKCDMACRKNHYKYEVQREKNRKI